MIRTRFAPSPTGHLHIGSARTALFNWLFSRHHGGKFILRIEDTDKVRSTEESTQGIFEAMKWLGLDWDEEVYYQSKRTDIYREQLKTLLSQGKAYRCYCDPDELEEKRKQAFKQGKKPKYNGKCRELTKEYPDKPFAIRFKSPESGQTEVNDLIKGTIVFENSELDDLIICRRDGTPTYNFVVVVDDATMGITHIIRGDDHVNNTPRQILLYQALNYQLPQFAHMPLTLGKDKARLSKRHGATSVMAYKEMGYLPQAVINFLVRLGWSYGDQEIFSKDELVEKFSLENVGKSAGIFNPDKLLWLNSHYIKEESDENLARLLTPFLEKREVKVDDLQYLAKVIKGFKERSKTLEEMADAALFYFKDEIDYQPKAAKKFLTLKAVDIFTEAISCFERAEDFREGEIEAIFNKITSERNISLGQIAQPHRVALTGSTASPGIYEVISNLGKERVIKRLKDAIAFIKDAEK
jgi:glutamyl-tRNA synthetase